MRDLAGLDGVRRFMRELGRASDCEARVYFTGGASAVLLGWRATTIDLDIKTGNDEGKKQPGIFKIDGSKLVVALAMPGGEKRPEKLEGGKGVVFAELKKAKE